MSTPETIDSQSITVLQVVLWGAVAGFGGAVKYVAAVIKSPEVISNRRFLALLAANSFISAFCGLMGMLLALTITDNWAVHGLASGCIGYLGTQGLDIVLLALKRKIEPNAPFSAVMPMPPEIDSPAQA